MKIKPEERIPRTQPFAEDLRTSNADGWFSVLPWTRWGAGGARHPPPRPGLVPTGSLSRHPDCHCRMGRPLVLEVLLLQVTSVLSEPHPPTPTARPRPGPWAPLPAQRRAGGHGLSPHLSVPPGYVKRGALPQLAVVRPEHSSGSATAQLSPPIPSRPRHAAGEWEPRLPCQPRTHVPTPSGSRPRQPESPFAQGWPRQPRTPGPCELQRGQQSGSGRVVQGSGRVVQGEQTHRRAEAAEVRDAIPRGGVRPGADPEVSDRCPPTHLQAWGLAPLLTGTESTPLSFSSGKYSR